jgi:hypothetical protein
VLPNGFRCEVVSLLLLWCDSVIVVGAGTEGPPTPTQKSHLEHRHTGGWRERGVRGERGGLEEEEEEEEEEVESKENWIHA